MAYYGHYGKKVMEHVDYTSNEDIDVDPPDHKLAAEQVLNWYEARNYIAFINKRIDYAPEFMSRHKIKYTFHKYDVWVYHKMLCTVMVVIEIDQRENDTYTLPEGNTIEITQSRHNTPVQIRRDNLAEDYIRQYYPKVHFLRIQKIDCFNKKKLSQLLRTTLK